jgi:hypothetical protein
LGGARGAARRTGAEAFALFDALSGQVLGAEVEVVIADAGCGDALQRRRGVEGARGGGAEGGGAWAGTIMLKNRTMCSPFVTVLMSDGAKLRQRRRRRRGGVFGFEFQKPNKYHRESTPSKMKKMS